MQWYHNLKIFTFKFIHICVSCSFYLIVLIVQHIFLIFYATGRTHQALCVVRNIYTSHSNTTTLNPQPESSTHDICSFAYFHGTCVYHSGNISLGHYYCSFQPDRFCVAVRAPMSGRGVSTLNGESVYHTIYNVCSIISDYSKLQNVSLVSFYSSNM